MDQKRLLELAGVELNENKLMRLDRGYQIETDGNNVNIVDGDGKTLISVPSTSWIRATREWLRDHHESKYGTNESTLTEQFDKDKYNQAIDYLATIAILDAKHALQDLSPEEIKADLVRTAKDYVDDSVAAINGAIDKKAKQQ